MIDNLYVEPSSFVWLSIGAVIFITVPVAAALLWKIRKKEPFTTVLVGAAVFVLFALLFEKPVQNALLFPTAMGLPEHAVSKFFAANPVLLALAAGLFPGVFEETGRLIAFKTALKKRKNRETSISFGIGHGGAEIIILLGITYIQYIVYAVMINTGTFGQVIDAVAAQAPDQVGAVETLARSVASFSFADFGIAFIERIFAVLLHVGASILVFYACKDKKKFFLYPLAVIIHTAVDFIAALCALKVITLPTAALEIIAALFGILTFLLAYLLLYRKDEKL